MNNVNNKEIIGKKIRQARMEKEMTIEELADKINVDKSVISRYETKGIAELEKINDICKVLNIDARKIIFDSPIIESKTDNKIKYDSLRHDVMSDANLSLQQINLRIDKDIKSNKNIIVFCEDDNVVYKNYDKLKNAGYQLNILNFGSRSYTCYNPFEYINYYSLLNDYEDLKVIEFSNYIIKNIYKKDETYATLLSALMLYLIKNIRKKEQNFISVLKLLRISQIDENNPNEPTPLDKIFSKVAIQNPNDIAVKQYMSFKNQSINKQCEIIGELTSIFSIFESIENNISHDNVELKKFINYKINNKALIIYKPKCEVLNPLYQIFIYQLKLILTEDYHNKHFF